MAAVIAGIQFRATGNVMRTLARMRSAFRGFSQNAGTHLRSLNRQMNKFVGSVDRMIGKLKGSRMGAMLGVGAMIYGARDAVMTLAEIEGIETAIKYASGTADNGAKNIEYLRKLTKDLKIDYLAAADGFKLFSASLIGTDVTLEDQQDMFTNISKAIRVFGLDANKTASVYYALSEMIGKGTIQAQELKQQLGNALPGAMQNFADSADKSRAQIMKLMEAGKLTTMKYLKPFADFMGKKVEPGVSKSIETVTANITDLNNTILFAKMDIGSAIVDAGAVDLIKKYVTRLREWVKLNKELISERLKMFFIIFGKILEFLWKNMGTIIEVIKFLIPAYIGLKAAQYALNTAMYLFPGSWIAAIIALIAVGIGYAAVKTEGWGDEWVKLSKMIEDAGKSIKYTFLSIKYSLLSTFSSIYLGFNKMIEPIRKFFEGKDFNEDVFNLANKKLEENIKKYDVLSGLYRLNSQKRADSLSKAAMTPSTSRFRSDKTFMQMAGEKIGLDLGGSNPVTGGANPNTATSGKENLIETVANAISEITMNITKPSDVNVDVSSPTTAKFIIDGVAK